MGQTFKFASEFCVVLCHKYLDFILVLIQVFVIRSRFKVGIVLCYFVFAALQLCMRQPHKCNRPQPSGDTGEIQKQQW